MELCINGFPIDEKILLIDSNHKSFIAVLGCRNYCDVFVKGFYGDFKSFENSKIVDWCYLPDTGI